jgi:ribonuclease-3
MRSASDKSSLDKLQHELGYRFDDVELLLRALSHRSSGPRHNERLEFLGDAILGYLVAKRLYAVLPAEREDALTLIRSSLVKRDSLARRARRIGLGQHLRLGAGERKSGGHARPSILADALEAVIGAVHEDGGLEAAEALVDRLFDEPVESLDAATIKDAKTRLQEVLQKAGLGLPDYAIVTTEGSDHQRLFRVSCRVDALELECVAEGSSRRAAEKQAARAMLEELDQRG